MGAGDRQRGRRMNYANVPMEISLGGIYFPPVMFAIILGIIMAEIIGRLLNRFDLVRFIWHPPLFFIAVAVICTWLASLYIIPI